VAASPLRHIAFFGLKKTADTLRLLRGVGQPRQLAQHGRRGERRRLAWQRRALHSALCGLDVGRVGDTQEGLQTRRGSRGTFGEQGENRHRGSVDQRRQLVEDVSGTLAGPEQQRLERQLVQGAIGDENQALRV